MRWQRIWMGLYVLSDLASQPCSSPWLSAWQTLAWSFHLISQFDYWGIFVECALCRSHLFFLPLLKFMIVHLWKFVRAFLQVVCLPLKRLCVCTVCVSVEGEGTSQRTTPQPLSTHLRGVLQQSPFIPSNHWLDKVEDLRLLSAEKRSAVFSESEHTPESSENETVTLLNTQWIHCVNFLFYPTFSFTAFLSSHLFMSSFLPPPSGNCGDPDAATSAEYQRTLNATFLKFSRELWKENNMERRWSCGRSRCW